MVRKHIKVEPARWYYWCDVLGMLVWQDMPAIGDRDNRPYLDKEIHANLRNRWSSDSFIGGTDCTIPQQWKNNYYKEWGEIIDALKCFQCIVVWVPFNGAWGYGSVLHSGDEVLDRYEMFAEMLKTFIETGCSAAVYTQTTDVEIEVNGLMTYDRNVKIDEDRLRKINLSVIESMK